MTIQPTMFGYADARTRQPVLFDTDGPPALIAKCQRCGEYLERTRSGYQTCPKGCLRLLPVGHWDAAGNCTACGEAGRCTCHHPDGDCHCPACQGRTGRRSREVRQ
ncbi:MAG TPA: hypothetical protein VH120_10290 [Gemmataceae bacterium]|nr:hypothetical protein [Gemmataceae bacterium]